MNAQDLHSHIVQNNITAEIIHLDVPTPTVAAAAAAVGVDPQQIIKSVLFLADKKPVLALANGLARIDRKVLADTVGVARRRTKIANPEQVLAHTGYVAGSVPPFGHVRPLWTIVDTAVIQLTNPLIYGGGGETNALLKLTVTELLRVTGGKVAYLSEQTDY
ncbi:MAG: YbaK/EbsC family protein [Chloroflexi bacterium]|nr:YbaK/EbsC family protein [Chloroflexota bacterium]